MTLETVFEKFDPFADASDAVAKMRGLVLGSSANGAPHTSLGQRPRKTAPHSSQAPGGVARERNGSEGNRSQKEARRFSR